MNYWNILINKGTEKFSIYEDKKKVRILNILCFQSIFLFIPIITIHNLIVKDYKEVVLIWFFLIPVITSLILNYRGKTQMASLILLTSAIIVILSVVLINQVQTAAPYVFILVALGAYTVLNNRILKISFITINFTLFIAVIFYQLENLPYLLSEYYPLLIIMPIIGFTIHQNDNENLKYRHALIDKNEQLEKQQEVIEEQSKNILKIQHEKHDKELELKRKDIKMLINSHFLQLKLKEKISDEINVAIKKDDPKKSLKTLLVELNSWKATDHKFQMLYQDMEVVSAQLFDSLTRNHPDISKSEKELCAYIRLGLSSKEIASIKVSTVNTINVAKTRLRKKLGLDANKEINSYLSGLL